MRTLEDLRNRRPVDANKLAQAKEQLHAEIRAYKLQELRKAQNKTQVEIARELQVSQNSISKLEHGNLSTTQIDTVRRYIESLGGKLNIEATFGDVTYKIA